MVTDKEESEVGSPAGVVMYLVNAIPPQAGMVASKMQQKVRILKACHLIEANNFVEKLLILRPNIRFIRPLGIAGMNFQHERRLA